MWVNGQICFQILVVIRNNIFTIGMYHFHCFTIFSKNDTFKWVSFLFYIREGLGSIADRLSWLACLWFSSSFLAIVCQLQCCRISLRVPCEFMRQVHVSLKYHENYNSKCILKYCRTQDFCLAIDDTGLSCVLVTASLFLCVERFSYLGDPQDIEY
jgi:hypothetical protein